MSALPLKGLGNHRKSALTLLLLYIGGLLFFMNTNPERLPLLLLIVPFIYIFAVLYLTILFVCRLLAVKSAAFVSLVISIFGVLLFVLGSLHQLTLRDLIISVALTCLLTWYVIRLNGQNRL
jgi:hypothetical protein